MVELIRPSIGKPESTETGRFGKLVREFTGLESILPRYWGIKLPIWRTEDNQYEICIGSLDQLQTEMDKMPINIGLISKRYRLTYIDPISTKSH